MMMESPVGTTYELRSHSLLPVAGGVMIDRRPAPMIGL